MSAVPAIEWLRLPGFDANSKTLHRAQLAGDCLRSVMDSKWTMIYTDTALEVRSGDLVCIHAYNRAGHYGRMVKELRLTQDGRWWAWSDDGIFQIGRLIRPVAIFRVVGLSADGYKRPPSGPGATPKDHETFARLAGDAVAEWARDGYPKGVPFPGVDAVNIPDPTRSGRPVILSGAVNATVDTPSYDEPDAPISFTVTGDVKGVLLKWDATVPVKRDQTYHVYQHTANTPFSSATRVWSGKTLSTLINLTAGTTRYYWVTSLLNGIESDAVENGTAGTPETVGTGDIASNAATSSMSSIGGAGSIGTDSPSGGSFLETTNTASYTNNTGASVIVQGEVSIHGLSTDWDTSYPSTARSYYDYSSSSSGSGGDDLVNPIPTDDPTSWEAGTSTAIIQVTLADGDALTLNLKNQVIHTNAVIVRWSSSAVRLTAIKR